MDINVHWVTSVTMKHIVSKSGTRWVNFYIKTRDGETHELTVFPTDNATVVYDDTDDIEALIHE